MDEILPPKNPWKDDSPTNTNKQWCPTVSKWCDMDFIGPQYVGTWSLSPWVVFVADSAPSSSSVIVNSLEPHSQRAVQLEPGAPSTKACFRHSRPKDPVAQSVRYLKTPNKHMTNKCTALHWSPSWGSHSILAEALNQTYVEGLNNWVEQASQIDHSRVAHSHCGITMPVCPRGEPEELDLGPMLQRTWNPNTGLSSDPPTKVYPPCH